MNDGAGWLQIAAPVGVLLAWGVVCFALALRVFKWQ